MNWHEIVKYSPQKYDSNGIYTADEWTSRCDVGKNSMVNYLLLKNI